MIWIVKRKIREPPASLSDEACDRRLLEMNPLSMGGDHSITGGVLQALGGSHASPIGAEKACLLHFDAHTDALHNILTAWAR